MSAAINEKDTIGRVTTRATIENLRDLWEAEKGDRPSQEVRRMTIDDALVGSGASTLSLPRSMIQQLGLSKMSDRRIITAQEPATAEYYGVARVTIQDRNANVDVLEVPDGCPVLVGQIPLELMDFVVDPANQRLIGNPAHGGHWTLELY